MQHHMLVSHTECDTGPPMIESPTADYSNLPDAASGASEEEDISRHERRCLCRDAGLCSMLLSHLDKIVVFCIHRPNRNSLPETLPDDLLHEAKRLRIPVGACFFITACVAGVIVSILSDTVPLIKPLMCSFMWISGERWQRILPTLIVKLLPDGIWKHFDRLKRAAVPQWCHQQSIDMLANYKHETLDRFIITLCGIIVAFCLVMMIKFRIKLIVLLYGSQGPANEAVVQRILRGPVLNASDDGNMCSICLDADDGCRWRELPCGHQYHEECLMEWLRRARHCPLCRQNLHSVYLSKRRLSAPLGSSGSSQQRSLSPEVALTIH
eukprot:gnl/TRDRNA2_/TRDRNA2_201320_c0_seq1.p1 gnl/TRDRNA2_/TRDRNA2_201320_c0~~gnl/TRDRNA2_/TRDRNA2_201320_c0_seq1.p1  ORF type:complete len:325 (-),score=42.13 gnl/TRDRNA2_/TRDRNA2_201320_c0_seq1:187-1161(-)